MGERKRQQTTCKETKRAIRALIEKHKSRISVEDLAEATGKSVSSVYKYSEETDETAWPQLRDIEAICRKYDDISPLLPTLNSLGYTAVRIKNSHNLDTDILEMYLRAAERMGNLAHRINAGLEDHVLTPSEWTDIENEARELQSILMGIRRKVE